MTLHFSLILYFLIFDLINSEASYSCEEFTYALDKWANSANRKKQCKELSYDATDAFIVKCRVYFINQQKFDRALEICQANNLALKVLMEVDILGYEREYEEVPFNENLNNETSAEKNNSTPVLKSDFLILLEIFVVFAIFFVWL